MAMFEIFFTSGYAKNKHIGSGLNQKLPKVKILWLLFYGKFLVIVIFLNFLLCVHNQCKQKNK